MLYRPPTDRLVYLSYTHRYRLHRLHFCFRPNYDTRAAGPLPAIELIPTEYSVNNIIIISRNELLVDVVRVIIMVGKQRDLRKLKCTAAWCRATEGIIQLMDICKTIRLGGQARKWPLICCLRSNEMRHDIIYKICYPYILLYTRMMCVRSTRQR